LGVDYTAHIAVGIRIDKSQLREIHDVPCGCGHTIAESAKFCPECGAEAVTKALLPIDGYDDEREKYKGLDVVRIDGHDGETVIVGVSLAAVQSEDNDPCEPLQLDYIRVALDEVTVQLKGDPLALNETASEIGIFLCMDCSY
jgi:hypothetical protein